MFSFVATSGWYQRLGLGLLLAQFSLFIFALPPFQSGIWLQTEPVLCAVFVFGIANALWCLWGMVSGALTCRPSYHPLWLCLLLWIGWQVVATILAPSPWRSWFGPPEMGEGVAWYVALWLLMIVAFPLWQVASCRRILLYMAIGNILVQGALHVFIPLSPQGRYVPGSWRPETWAAYLAFMGGYIWVAWAMAGRSRTFVQYVAMVIFMVATLMISHNASAQVLLGGTMLASVGVRALSRYRPARRLLYPNRRWRMVMMAGCLLPLSWVVFSACFPSFEPYTSTSRIRPLVLLSDRDGSMGARLYLNQMAVSALGHEPRRWFVGSGWGSVSDVVMRYALVDGVTVFTNGVRKPSNLMVDGYSFHSHNQPLEALLSLGIPGLVLWLMVPLLSLWMLPKRYFWPCAPMLVGLAGLSNVWFELAQCLPYKALALAAVSSAYRHRQWQVTYVNARRLMVVVALAAGAMAWSAYGQKEAMDYGQLLRDAPHALPHGDYSQSWLEQDIIRGGDRFRDGALFYATWLSLKMRNGGLDENDAHWYGKFLEAAEAADASRWIGPSVASLEIRLKNIMLVNLTDPALDGMRDQVAQSMPGTILQLAERAPLRDDVAALFLANLPNILPDTGIQLDYLHKLLAIAPNHRGALWVLGGLLKGVPGRETEGLNMQREAVALGVEHVYPVTDEQLTVFK